jgi:hypothetical protein
VGFERQRTLTTAFNVSPVIGSWIRPRLTFTSSFTFTRDPNARNAVRVDGDTAGAFRAPESFANSRRRELGATLYPARLFGGIVGDSNFVGRLFGRLQPVDVAVQRDRRSSFDRPIVDAPFRYQLALGGLDDFRSLNGVPATAAGEIQSLTAASGVFLPLGLTARANYRDARGFTWSRRFGSAEQGLVSTRTREWPTLSASWTLNTRRVLRVVSGINANARFSETRNESEQSGVAGGEGSRSETRARAVSPNLTVTWAGGIVTNLQYNRSTSEQVTSGNVTQRLQRDLGGTASFAFRPPRSLVRIPNDIRTTIAYNRAATETCLLRVGSEECTSVSNSIRSALDVRMDTGFSSQIRGGLSLSHVVTTQEHTSSEVAQTVFTISVEILFLSGQLR